MNRSWLFGSIGLVTLASWLWLGAAHAQGSASRENAAPRIGVLVTLRVNATPEETQRLSSALAASLRRTFVLDAAIGEDLPAIEVPDDCIARRECVRDLARDLGVDQILFLTIVRVGERFQVAITWGGGDDGRTVSRVSIDIDVAQQDPEPVFAVYARRLLPDAKLRPQGSDGATNGMSAGDANSVSGDSSRILDDQPSARRMTRGAWIAAGAGAVFLAAGAGVGWSARSAYNQLDQDQCQTVMCADTDIDRLASRARTADLLFGAAVIAGATSAVLYWRSGRKARIGGADVSAYTNGRDVGVTFGGRF